MKKLMKKLTTEDFIKKAMEVHGDKYDYSKVIYYNTTTKVPIDCKTCEKEFEQSPVKHLSGRGCPFCKLKKLSEKFRMSIETFKERANKVHNSKYNYDELSFNNLHDKVIINCPEHGSFTQEAQSHLVGCGCPKCSSDLLSKKFRMSKEEFISRSIAEHEIIYDYSEVEYVNNSTPVTISCRIHGKFRQLPSVHIKGANCPNCYVMSSLERSIENALISMNIQFEKQKTWDWLVFSNKQHLDFFLPKYNIAIECQGRQHFESVELFGGDSVLEMNKKRDENKRRLCEENGIKIFYFSNLSKPNKCYQYPYKVYEDIDKLMNEIKRISPTN